MEKINRQKIGDTVLSIVKFYIIGMFWVLLFLSCLYVYDYARYGFVWKASDRDTFYACVFIGVPMGIASWLIVRSFKK